MEEQNKSKEYIRNYMKKRYIQDPIKASQIRNSNLLKAKQQIPPEDLELFKHYLADAYRVNELLKRMPKEIVDIIFDKHKMSRECI